MTERIIMPIRRTLILEDDLGRMVKFRENIVGEICHVTTAKECIERLQTETWDQLFLDHDLGGQINLPSGPGTGYEVACWLEEHDDRQPPRIVLHSYNVVGIGNMAAALPSAVVLPGAWDYVW